jgi:MFS family permease
MTDDAAVDTAADHAWLTPGVRGIGTASLLADVGHEIPTALLPSLLTSTIGAPASALGLIEGVSDGLAGVARLGGGALADDPHRRRAVAVGGYTTTAVLAAGTGFATTAWQVGLLRAGAWTARGLRVPARNALLADVVHPSAYGRAYGFERAMDNLGAIVGPILAIGLVATIGTRWAIAVSVIPGIAAALAIVYAIRHTRTVQDRERIPIRLRIRPVLALPGLRRLFAGIGLFELANIAATLLILRATELLEPRHGNDTAAQLALALYVAYNVAATVTSLAAGHLTDRRTPALVLALGAAAFAAAYLGLTIDTDSWLALLPWFVAAGIGIGAVETAQHAAVASATPDQLRGSAFGLLAGTQSLGNLVASTIAGIIWTAASPTWAFTVIGLTMLAATGLLATSRPSR